MNLSNNIIFICLIIYCIVWLIIVSARYKNLEKGIVSFGTETSSSNHDENKVVLNQYLEQQRITFSILCVAITIGIILGGFLMGRVLFSAKIDVEVISSAFGVDIALGASSYKLYKLISKNIQDILKSL